MDPDLEQVYRRFGFDPTPAATDATLLGADPTEKAADRDRVPTIVDLDRERERLDRDPEGVLRELRGVWDSQITEWQVRAALQEARDALSSPPTFLAADAAEKRHADESQPLPPDFSFPGMDLDEIGIKPGAWKFEPAADAVGWALSWVSSKLNAPQRPPFRRHTDFASGFTYPLVGPAPGAPVEVALFSDFGTGQYYSQYIARQIRQLAPAYAFHLGDVYYAGQQKEFDENFTPFVDGLLAQTRLFLLVANHEMMARGKPYCDYLDLKRGRFPAVQEQEGTYFRVRGERFQIVGVDTDWFGKDKLPADQVMWLADALREGRARGAANILLTANVPYEYGSAKLTKLYTRAFRPLAEEGLIDLWFWGDTHYCALFDRGAPTPFIGSCIGHAGHPFPKKALGRPEPAPIRFLETAARFPKSTGLRQDAGDPGFCTMTLRPDGTIRLRYLDWMSNLRCEAELARPAPGAPLQLKSCTPFPEP